MFGFDVFSSFDKIGSDGIMPVPNKTKEKFLGGHCVVAGGYDNDKECFIVRNSWGPSWGDNGYFYIPYSVMVDSSTSDFWVVNQVSLQVSNSNVKQRLKTIITELRSVIKLL